MYPDWDYFTGEAIMVIGHNGKCVSITHRIAEMIDQGDDAIGFAQWNADQRKKPLRFYGR